MSISPHADDPIQQLGIKLGFERFMETDHNREKAHGKLLNHQQGLIERSRLKERKFYPGDLVLLRRSHLEKKLGNWNPFGRKTLLWSFKPDQKIRIIYSNQMENL